MPWGRAVNKSDLIDRIAEKQRSIPPKDVAWAVKMIVDHLSLALLDGTRIEIRGFGSFSLRYRKPRMGRNPKTGEVVSLPGKHLPHFKPGKGLREQVQSAYKQETVAEG